MASIRPLLALIVLVCARPVQGQDVAYLAGVPTAQQVAQGLVVPSPRETAARRYAALFALSNLVGSGAGAGAAPSPQALERIASFTSMKNQVYEAEKQRDPTPYLLEQCSQAYSESPAFQRELLDLYFTPAWQAAYGPRLDPRRWKVPLAMAPGAKVTAASMSPPMVEECGSAPAAAAPRAAVAVAPSNDPVEIQRAEAKAILKAGDTTRAINAYKQIVSAYPSRTEGYAGLGGIYVSQHQYALALPAWQKVAELAPTDGFSRFMVGASYVNLRRYEEARDVLRTVTVMKTSPENLGWAHYMLGVAYLRLGQRESAMESYRALAVLDTVWANKLAVELNAPPKTAAAAPPAASSAQVEAIRAEGKKYYEAKEYTKARASYEKLLRISPNDGWALYELGLSLLMAEGYSETDSDSMLAVWTRAVELNSTDTELLLTLGDALNSWDPAVADAALQRVLDLKPDAVTQARAHAGKGWNHYFYMNSRSAEAEFKEALRLDPANDQYLYNVGINYAKSGQRDAAMGVFRQLTTRNQKMAQELWAQMNKK